MIETDHIADVNRRAARAHERDLAHLRQQLGDRGIDAQRVIDELVRLSVAVPSWALGSGGTRFGRFSVGGEPRTLEEKVDDVALLHQLTGSNATISLHIPWDRTDDPAALRQYASTRGIAFDAMNSNTFQDNPETTGGGATSFRFGSMANTDPAAREAAIAHNLDVIAMGQQLGSRALSIWLGDGTNHPGQASLRGQFERVAECLGRIHDALPADWVMFTEHKPYEPAFYSTVNADWGSSLLLSQAAGERSFCLVDLGHHLPNANIEQIVSRLAMVGRLGGFHFNDSKYGDDDLTTGSIRPFQLFLIFHELVTHGGGRLPDLLPGASGASPAYMIDQSHNTKDPLEDLLQSTEALALAYAQALIVDPTALGEAQEANDATRGQQLLSDAFRTDVRPLLAEARRVRDGALDPLAVYRDVGYRDACRRERGTDSAATGL